MSLDSENFDKLVDMTLQGKWGGVVKIYENGPSTNKARITQTGGTALHAAVIQGQKEIVSRLVEVILKEYREALRSQNDAGYTALHHAASMGSLCMCKCIAKDYPQLITTKTKRSETPLYIAVVNGQKDAFSYLHSLCSSSESMAPRYAKKGHVIGLSKVEVSLQYGRDSSIACIAVDELKLDPSNTQSEDRKNGVQN
ncbi:hypothetical protein FEM48_ZijujUnG0082000 [Ziziphus jujuba var. spinosa]|uniref:Uncharacterized protein n=1 Tax=Ziziphus jujuba var. spinosa TaxID=714518 RepID=A0A978U8N0_ZIZJJ|nr:hypothetical protein FEM48_ZijujUnG0082000 [Ziziphus jujuba var. spinosa]